VSLSYVVVCALICCFLAPLDPNIKRYPDEVEDEGGEDHDDEGEGEDLKLQQDPMTSPTVRTHGEKEVSSYRTGHGQAVSRLIFDLKIFLVR